MPLTIGAIAGGVKALTGVVQMVKGSKIHPQYKPYTANPAAATQLATAQNLFNGRMGGAVNAERNIANSQANANANASRNASDGSQALALGQLSQGQANAGYEDLASREAQNKAAMAGNLNQAFQTVISEGDKEHQSAMQKYQMDSQTKAALTGDGLKNISGGIGDVAGTAILTQGQGVPKLKPIGAGEAGGFGNNFGVGSLMSTRGNYNLNSTPQQLSYRNTLLGQ